MAIRRGRFGAAIVWTPFFLDPIIRRDQNLADELKLGGDPVSFLWVVPLSAAECNLKLEKGLGALLNLFTQHRHPYVFDPTRKSYV
jgi:hypothetical protein